jgi:hypothetical protein
MRGTEAPPHHQAAIHGLCRKATAPRRLPRRAAASQEAKPRSRRARRNLQAWRILILLSRRPIRENDDIGCRG